MPEMTNAQLADWLEELHSHEVYNAKPLLAEIPDDVAARVPVRTAGEIRKQMAEDPRGGHMDPAIPDDLAMVSGYTVALGVAVARLGAPRVNRRVGRLHGRGFMWRACVELLREADD